MSYHAPEFRLGTLAWGGGGGAASSRQFTPGFWTVWVSSEFLHASPVASHLIFMNTPWNGWFYTWGNWGSEELSAFFRVTELLGGDARTGLRVIKKTFPGAACPQRTVSQSSATFCRMYLPPKLWFIDYFKIVLLFFFLNAFILKSSLYVSLINRKTCVTCHKQKVTTVKMRRSQMTFTYLRQMLLPAEGFVLCLHWC